LKLLRLPYKLALALPVLFLLYFYGLADVGMLGPDEPRYAAIGREMARSGDWITPRLWGTPWFEKPALLYWMVGAGNRLGLGDELAPRLPVALLSVWFLAFYFLRMRREFGERSAWFSTGMLATSAGWLAYSHAAVTDLPLAATFSASMLLALPWVRSGGRRGLIFAGILMGFAVLAKGLVPLVLALPLLWVGRRRWMDLLIFGGAALVVAAPWYLLCYWQNGAEFIDTFFWKHHFGRFVSSELQHVQPWWFYFAVLPGLLFPWIPALAALWGLEWREPRKLLLTGWVVFGFLFFTASSNKLPGYMLPLLPAITALIGIQLASKPIRFAVPASALLLALTPVASAVLPEAMASGLRRASMAGIQWTVVAGIIAAAAGIVYLERRSLRMAFAATTGLTVASLVWLISTTFPRLDETASARLTWRAMVERADIQCIDDVSRSVRYGLNYYAGQELPSCSAERERNHGILDRDKGISR
jgi:4-amino-4-deoxy-L-arabinose transferase-like glycosyltransferase